VLARDLNRRLYGGIREAVVPEDPFESRVLVFDQIFVSKLEEVAARVVPRAHLGDGPATGPPYFKEQPFGFGQRTQRLLIRPAAEPIIRRVHPFLVGPQVVPVPGNRNVARVAHDVGSTDRAAGEELVTEISAVHEQILTSPIHVGGPTSGAGWRRRKTGSRLMKGRYVEENVSP